MDIAQVQQYTLAGMLLVTVGFFFTLRTMALRQSAENQEANQAAAERRAAGNVLAPNDGGPCLN